MALPFRAVAWIYFLLPRALQALLETMLAGLLAVLGFRRKVIRENLRIAFPQGAQGMEWRAYRHLARLSLEILMLFGPMRRHATRRGELQGRDNWKRESDKGRGVLFLSSHVGNWEIMAATGALSGMDLMLVTKHLKPEWLHQAIERGRLTSGVRATYEPRTLRDVLGHLKKGGTVGFVLDQYAGPPVGVRVPFLGVAVGTNSAVAMLAKRTGAAVVPVVNYRTDDGRLVVRIEPALDWKEAADPQEELAINTARYAAVLEGHVREHPEQWLWTHRRFKGDLSPLRPGEWLEGRPRR